MKQEINWDQLAMRRKWCAAEMWNRMMANIKTSEDKDSTGSFNSLTEEEKILRRKEQAKKTRDALLAKNPNHFKELSAKAHAKRKEG